MMAFHTVLGDVTNMSNNINDGTCKCGFSNGLVDKLFCPLESINNCNNCNALLTGSPFSNKIIMKFPEQVPTYDP
jgi:hypothetical protein